MKHRDWNQLLEQLQASLAVAATELERHEQTLASPLLSGEGNEENRWRQSLGRFDERLHEFHQWALRSEKAVASAESVLAEREAEILQFRERLDEVRQQLANVPAAVIE